MLNNVQHLVGLNAPCNAASQTLLSLSPSSPPHHNLPVEIKLKHAALWHFGTLFPVCLGLIRFEEPEDLPIDTGLKAPKAIQRVSDPHVFFNQIMFAQDERGLQTCGKEWLETRRSPHAHAHWPVEAQHVFQQLQPPQWCISILMTLPYWHQPFHLPLPPGPCRGISNGNKSNISYCNANLARTCWMYRTYYELLILG